MSKQNPDAINNNDYKLEKLFFDTPGEKLHFQFCRNILGVVNKTSIAATLGELGCYPLMIKCFNQMIKYWHYIRTEVDHDTFIYKTISLLQEGETKGQKNWLSSVKFVLRYCGMENIWLNPNKISSDSLGSKCNAILRNKYIKYWFNLLDSTESSAEQNEKNSSQGKNKLRTYSLIKKEYRIEDYLILRSKRVTETVPTCFKEKEPPIISYTYTKINASKIFNFSSTLLHLDYHQFHNNPSPCECNTSSHLYEPSGHVITGDFSIIPNSKLRDLIAEGPKYREPCKVDWDKIYPLLCEAVDQYALQWAKREIVELSVLSSWKEMVKGQTGERISKLKQNFKQPTGKVLQNVDVKACLSDLHNKYVFVPADKAPNNIIIIRKRYYIETLIKELGLDNCSTPTGNSTYTSCQMSS